MHATCAMCLATPLPPPLCRTVFIYAHGNATDIGRCHMPLRRLAFRLRVHILVVEYPGYGIAPGRPTEETVVENITAAYMHLHEKWDVPKDRIIMMGRSIGTGPCIDVASLHEVGGLVSVSGFTSITPVANHVVGQRCVRFNPLILHVPALGIIEGSITWFLAF